MSKAYLNRIPTVELLRELERRQAMAGEYEARRAAMEKELAAIDAEIAALQGASGTRVNGAAPRHIRRSAAARTRAANQVPLNMALHNLLKGKTMSVSEAAEAVRKSGYKSNAANFTTVVNLTLLKRTDLFRRVGRGKYTAR
ncbi:MAG: hypothetical protein KJZ69_17730 [Phycisphaerales bacterium]|nr:hypothetical protein [Phycisphaerales bacterium]